MAVRRPARLPHPASPRTRRGRLQEPAADRASMRISCTQQGISEARPGEAGCEAARLSVQLARTPVGTRRAGDRRGDVGDACTHSGEDARLERSHARMVRTGEETRLVRRQRSRLEGNDVGQAQQGNSHQRSQTSRKYFQLHRAPPESRCMGLDLQGSHLQCKAHPQAHPLQRVGLGVHLTSWTHYHNCSPN